MSPSKSLFSLFAASLACFSSFASAYTQPKGAAPEGNPIFTPGLSDVLPVGESYAITWNPTTSGTVTLVLLKGPSADAVAQYPIAENIRNDGRFIWVPATNLAPGHVGYGIQLIDDATGQYQYSTQFGISNPDYSKPSSSPAHVTSDASSTFATETKKASATEGAHHTLAGHPIVGNSNSTIPCPTAVSKTWAPSGTGLGHNSSIVMPTKPMTVPSSLITPTATPPPYISTAPSNATATRTPLPTGGAAQMTTSFLGLVVAAAVAVFAL